VSLNLKLADRSYWTISRPNHTRPPRIFFPRSIYTFPMNVPCRICGEGVSNAEDSRELVIVEACHCHVHKACFLERLAVQMGEPEWVCACSKRPMRGYRIIPMKGAPEREYRELPPKMVPESVGVGTATQAVTRDTLGLSPLAHDYFDLPRLTRMDNFYLRVIYQHPDDSPEVAASVECILGANITTRARDLLKLLMLALNVAVVQPCADLVQPSMTNVSMRPWRASR
jgi:hypothetical protein